MPSPILYLIPALWVITSVITAAQVPSDTWWQDPQVNEWNRRPMRTSFFAYESLPLARAGRPEQSAWYRSLNGNWKFHWVESPSRRPEGFWQPGFDDSGWQDFPVPATWERHGFGIPIYVNHRYEFDYLMKPDPPRVPEKYNPVGSYRRMVRIDPSWQGKQVFLHFGAVKSNLYVWVNGQFVGYSEDSKLPAEFDITPFVRFDEPNCIAFQVFRWSDGTYLECQDMWRVSGVHRNVFLYARHSPLFVENVEAVPDLENQYRDGVLHMRIALSGYPHSLLRKARMEIRLYDGERVMAEKIFSNLTDTSRFRRFDLRLPGARLWSAETPHLYQLVVALHQEGFSEFIPFSTGFRKVEIHDGNFLVNGRRILLKGVNRHEMDPVMALVMTRERMEEDIRILKMLNINTLRTCHYPDDPYIYELADRYGLYVIDEANVESHGMGYLPERTLGNRPDWLLPTWQRIGRMIDRDINHPSIVLWSMGNEAGNGIVFETCYRRIKQRDPSRPVHYERAEQKFNTDVYCPMYPSVAYLKRYATENIDPRPLIMCEYEHAMGNSLGNFKEYWDVIRNNPKLQGGSIWDFADQAWLEKDENGKPVFTYGGDYGINMPSDTNFLCNGLVAPDRQIHPHAWEAKYFYQDIWPRLIDSASLKIEVYNEYFFKNLENVRLQWTLTSAGTAAATGGVESLDIGPQERKVLDLGHSVLPGREEILLQVSFTLKYPEGLLPAGYEVAKGQMTVREAAPVPLTLTPDGLVFFEEIGHEGWPFLNVGNERIRIRFDQKTGFIDQYQMDGVDYLGNQFQVRPNFWRPPTDNDYGARLQRRLFPWKLATERPVLRSMETGSEDGLAVITCRYRMPDAGAKLTLRYRINGRGEMMVEQTLEIDPEKAPMLPRLGMQWILPAGFDKVEWYGRGPHENYEDRNSSALIGRYDQTVADQVHPYVRPQETGNRTDVRWARVYDADGSGLRIESDRPFGFSAKPLLDEDLDEGWDKRNRHYTDLPERRLTCLNVDYRQMGVGGTDSWGALPLEQYRLEEQRYEWRFKVVPVR